MLSQYRHAGLDPTSRGRRQGAQKEETPLTGRRAGDVIADGVVATL